MMKRKISVAGASREAAATIDANGEHHTIALGNVTMIARAINSKANATDVVYALKSMGWVLKSASWICRA